MKRVAVFVLGFAVLAISGCQQGAGTASASAPAGPSKDEILKKAVGIYDLQWKDRDIPMLKALKPDEDRPFTMLRIDPGGKFRLAMWRMDPKIQKYKGVLATGTITVAGNELTMLAEEINKKKQAKPKTLVYKLSEDGSALVHRDGTTFLKRIDAEKKAGNADVDAYLEQLKSAENAGKSAPKLPAPGK